MTDSSKEKIDEIFVLLNIQKGGVPGIDTSAPANDSFYLSCEHTDPETEKDSEHLTNYDTEVAEARKAVQSLIDSAVKAELNRANEFELSSEYGASIRWQDYYQNRKKELSNTKEEADE